MTETPQHEFEKPRDGAKNWDVPIRNNWDKADTLIPKTGLETNRPTAGVKNRLYFATDTRKIYYDDGSSWVLVAPALEEIPSPSASDLDSQQQAWDSTNNRIVYKDSGGTVHYFSSDGTV